MMFSYRHPERSRGIFLALRSLSHWHCQGNHALVLRISAFSHPSFIALQRRFLASLEMTIRESDVSQSPSHQSLEVSHPRFQTWIPHFPYRHPERSRGIFLALRSLSHWHCQGNHALVLRISAFSHPSFIALQRRFLASLEMTIRESDVSQSPSHQSLEVSHPRFQTWIPHFPYRHPERSRGIFLALRSLSHWHWQGNDALVLRISVFSHPSFIRLQERFLASLEMTIRESDVS